MNEEMMKAMAGKQMPEMAIVESNTLAAMGLRQLLESVMPTIGLRKQWLRQGRSFIRKTNECLGAFLVIKVTVIKVIKDFRLFKMSDPKYGLCKKLRRI